MSNNPSAQLPVALSLTGRAVNRIWAYGVNTCHAPLLLREDLQRHIELARAELGFRYLRCHGILSDAMQVVADGGEFDFARIGTACDAILARGMLPFMELSHMPGALARSDAAICHYRFRTAPPRDWQQWYLLIRALVEYLRKRYGRTEVARWRFEVWNEPDIAFWSGTQAEYFKLYDLAARAIKEVDPGFAVGGPATSKTAWIDEFLAHVTRPSVDFGLDINRCDFVSTHAYPSDLEFLDAASGSVQLRNSNIMRELFAQVRRKVSAVLGEGVPVICGEWNSSAGPLAFNHDECNNAAFIGKTMTDLAEVVQGAMYWNLSDIYEECDFHHEPFHGGYGLLTVNDLPKASYHAFRLLAGHAGQRVALRWPAASPGLGGYASYDQQTLRVTLFNCREPDQPATAASFPLAALLAVGGKVVRVTRIMPGHGSAYETWVEAGRPSFANRELLAVLERASRPQIKHLALSRDSGEIMVPSGTMVQFTVPLVEWTGPVA